MGAYYSRTIRIGEGEENERVVKVVERSTVSLGDVIARSVLQSHEINEEFVEAVFMTSNIYDQFESEMFADLIDEIIKRSYA